jgi:hypothetical protein
MQHNCRNLDKYQKITFKVTVSMGMTYNALSIYTVNYKDLNVYVYMVRCNGHSKTSILSRSALFDFLYMFMICRVKKNFHVQSIDLPRVQY